MASPEGAVPGCVASSQKARDDPDADAAGDRTRQRASSEVPPALEIWAVRCGRQSVVLVLRHRLHGADQDAGTPGYGVACSARTQPSRFDDNDTNVPWTVCGTSGRSL